MIAPSIACSLLVDTSDLSGVEVEAGDVEAGSDAGSDGSPLGDATVSDSGVDATPFCANIDAGYFTFCDDFDGQDLGAKWTLSVNPPSSYTIDSTSFLSAPKSLAVTVPVNGGQLRTSRLTRSLGGSAAHAECRFDLRLDEAPNDLQRVAQFELYNGSNALMLVALDVSPASSSILVSRRWPDGQTEQAIRDIGGALSNFPIGQWRTVDIYIDFNVDNDGSLDFSLDGTARSEQPLFRFFDTAGASFNVGLIADLQANARFAYHLDNVACSTK